jgi:hypothetical protein
VYYESTNNTFAMWIWSPAPAVRAPEVGSVADFRLPLVFMPYATISNSWPATVELNGTNVYYLVCAAPESSRLFKVFVETSTATPPTLDVRSLKIDGADLAATLAGKSTNGHIHAIEDVTGLTAALNNLPVGAIVATNQGAVGQSYFYSGGTPDGVSTGYFATAAGSGDMLISVYDSGGAKQVVFTNDLRVVNALTNAAAFDAAGTAAASTSGIPAQITAAINSPYQEYDSVGEVIAGTCTVTFASGSLVKLTATNSPTVLTFDNADFPTSGVSRVAVELWAGTNSITFPTATITHSVAPTISTNDWTSLIFRRSGNNAVWTGGQVK